MNNEPRRALVTGGSGTVGSAVCRALAHAGHHVLIHANEHAEAAEQLAQALCAAGGSAESLRFDVTDANACRAVLEQVLKVGPVQILVNNAGICDDAVFAGMTAPQWQRVIDVTVNGFYNVTQPLMLPMIRTRWGRVVNISSVAALAGNRGQVNYAAAKGALNAATRALALEVATRGITVNAVAPGIIDSGMTAKLFDQEAIARLVPMKRAGKAEEVGELVAFLASEQAAYITAQIISVNGGMI